MEKQLNEQTLTNAKIEGRKQNDMEKNVKNVSTKKVVPDTPKQYPILWFDKSHRAAISIDGKLITYLPVDATAKVGDQIDYTEKK